MVVNGEGNKGRDGEERELGRVYLFVTHGRRAITGVFFSSLMVLFFGHICSKKTT